MTVMNVKQISNIESLIEESKIFLEQVNPYGIVIYTRDIEGKNNYTILHKGDNYILIIPDGNQEKARMYGNWEEALYASKRLICTNLALQKILEVSIGQYFS